MALSSAAKHMLKLAEKGADEEGWARASRPVYQALKAHMPEGLLELQDHVAGEGMVRLTDEGKAVLKHL